MSNHWNNIFEESPMTKQNYSRITVDHIAAMLAYWDSNLVCRFANNAYTNWFGKTNEEVVNKLTMQELLGSLFEKSLPHIEGVLAGTPQEFEREVLARNGERRVLLANYYPDSVNGKVKGFAVHVTDVTKSKKIKEELKISGERNRIFIQQSPNAIAMFDKEMRYMAASEKWMKDYGIVGREIIGQSHYEVFPEIGDDWKTKHQNCLKGDIDKCNEFPFERADGTTQWISWDVRPWHVSEGIIGGLLIQTTDITDLKEKEIEKHRVEEILDKTNEVARIGTWEVDLKVGKPIWSRVTKEIHEVPPDYLPDLGTAINFFKEGESRKKIEKAVTAAIELGTPYDLEVELVTAKGNNVWARAIGQVEFENGICKRLYGVFQDISGIKKAESDLRRLNEELETILDSGHVSIITTNVDGIITHFNKGAERLLQYTSEELIGIHTPEFIHLESEVKKRGIELTEELGYPINGFDVFVEGPKKGLEESRQWTYVRKDGSTFQVLLVINPILNSNNEITGYVGIGSDISERVENQKMLIETKSNLEDLSEKLINQNKQLASFAQITSHNLRAPVSNLSSLLYLYNIAETEEDKALMFEKFEMVIKHLTSTLNSLIESIQIKGDIDQTRENILFQEVFVKTTEMLNAEITSSGALITADFSEVKQINYNRIYLESIFLNLITNAIKYRSPERKPIIKIIAKEKNNFITLSFKDNGLGIDLKKHQDKLFGLHKTFHRHKEAKGVGLFITKTQVEAMGGNISAKSKVNEGTTFIINFNKENTNHG
jgi:PAS domain S-box-containing protein